MEIKSDSRFAKKYTQFNLKDIIHHKLDRTFLGGYLLTDTKKHLLFFSTKSELNKYEEFLKKHHPQLYVKSNIDHVPKFKKRVSK